VQFHAEKNVLEYEHMYQNRELGPSMAGMQCGRGQHVLVVDDEPSVLQFVKTLLERLGYVVTAMTNPVAALEQFAPCRYDLVITDLKMPQMSGHAFGSRILEIEPTTPVIMITGAAMHLDISAAYARGFADVVLKPWDIFVFAETVAKAMGIGVKAAA
jgi:CheY-like chemotaxis protein